MAIRDPSPFCIWLLDTHRPGQHQRQTASLFPMMQIIPHLVSVVKDFLYGEEHDLFIIFKKFYPTLRPSSQLMGTQEPSNGGVFWCTSCPQKVKWCCCEYDETLTLSSDCQDVPLYRQYCRGWKHQFGCSDVVRPDWYVSINSLCRKTCGLCGNVNMMEDKFFYM